ncbi:MAG: 2-hydroxyacyl-CoA dehydratase [Lachnospiraceae bacterium]|nr:2-hydroxyacyl-CoA dehydratase [Lachnospiraceae bacterium]
MEDKKQIYHVGLDIGSTTVKAIAIDPEGKVAYSAYRRHHAEVRAVLEQLLEELLDTIGDAQCTIEITGSGGLQLAERLQIPFVQEVVAVVGAVRQLYPQTDVIIELGGEDAKLVYLTGGVEQRMNGICAGGTGAFIDQMASLLQTDAAGLDVLAKDAHTKYPIAARCGVFAKTDIQPLINDGVAREDLAISIFQAVVDQTISGLACGRRIKGKVAFLGGPLHFLPRLRERFADTLHLTPEETIVPENAHLFAARGAAIHGMKGDAVSLKELRAGLANVGTGMELEHLPCLFETEADLEAFRERQRSNRVPRKELSEFHGNCFLGIDGGSTTTKMTLLSEDGELLYSYYGNNKGDPVGCVKEAMRGLSRVMPKDAKIVHACSTGYGEKLLKEAFGLDEGEVETIAHYYAARFVEPKADCIIDIGGQDMKCIRIKNGSVDSILLNEACSSGCGSFIENFADSLGYTAESFSELALKARMPLDLGTRCTIFMNSNVKQAQKEGAAVEDIAAGLAYSVVKNALFKVIRMTDPAMLGEHIIAQGGTFLSDAILRCFELVSGREVVRPAEAGLMGALGAALIAKERWNGGASTMLSFEEIEELTFTTTQSRCQGCQNRCRLTVGHFSNGHRYITGNRCERVVGGGGKANPAPNLFEYKRKRMFAYPPLEPVEAKRGVIGIPRVLNMYENYPFWAVFFKRLGFRVVLSPFSDQKLYRLGMDSIPSESECYPAKMVHGHIAWLVEQGVEQIFYPCVFYERKETASAQNHYNCPMVISYPENIRNNMQVLSERQVKLYTPFIAFTDEHVLAKCLEGVMQEHFAIGKKETRKAVRAAWAELLACKADVLEEGRKTVAWLKEHDAHGLVLAGRPYHLDPEINHGIPEMVHSLGFAVLTEDSVAGLGELKSGLRVTNQWMYHARLYAAAEYVAGEDHLDLIQFNSFGCGLDAITADQVRDLLEQRDKLYALLKIDEVSNLGAARIRVRSMAAAIRARKGNAKKQAAAPLEYKRVEYTREMNEAGYTILCPEMSPHHFELAKEAFRVCGYRLELMKNENRNVIDMGQRYVNHDACYPAMIVTGQIMDAVSSGNYDTKRLAVLMVQTGGGCRASNYVGFIRKALKEGGYGHIPVISLNVNGMETNSGFSPTAKLLYLVMQAAMYGDLLTNLLYHARPYEPEEGIAEKLYRKWQGICKQSIASGKGGMSAFYKNCRQMVQEFDRLELREDIRRPRVGIVGEVLVKYMPLANEHLADQLEKEGAEVVMPEIVTFLEYCFSGAIYRGKRLGKSRKAAMAARLGLGLVDSIKKKVDKILEQSRHFTPAARLSQIREYALEILQQGNQTGEGWFLPGEMIELIHQGVNNIVCVQPFGCLPNHIVGKGVTKKIKEKYPQANIVAIDYDPSASKVNQLNRLRLMLEVAEEQLQKEVG